MSGALLDASSTTCKNSTLVLDNSPIGDGSGRQLQNVRIRVDFSVPWSKLSFNAQEAKRIAAYARNGPPTRSSSGSFLPERRQHVLTRVDLNLLKWGGSGTKRLNEKKRKTF